MDPNVLLLKVVLATRAGPPPFEVVIAISDEAIADAWRACTNPGQMITAAQDSNPAALAETTYEFVELAVRSVTPPSPELIAYFEQALDPRTRLAAAERAEARAKQLQLRNKSTRAEENALPAVSMWARGNYANAMYRARDAYAAVPRGSDARRAEFEQRLVDRLRALPPPTWATLLSSPP